MSTLRAVFLLFAAAPSIAWAADPPAAKPATSKVTAVTVYQTSALVTREVSVPDAQGVLELVVSPLPPTAVLTSLYSEGGNGLRVLSTRGRTRAVREDTHEEVRKLESQIKALQVEQAKLQSDLKAVEANSQLLNKLESFTSASLTHLTEKGQLNSEGILTLAKQIMDQRSAMAKEIIANQQKSQTNQEQIEFLQRQLGEVGTRTSRTEIDCVIIVDKANAGAAAIRLNYLVEAASWKPQYKLRSGRPKDPISMEYLAGVEQHTGEDWNSVRLTLSTAQPQLNAGPPDLKSLEVAAIGGGGAPPMGGVVPGETDAGKAYQKLQEDNRSVRMKAQGHYNQNDSQQGSDLLNSAAAREQAWDLLTGKEGLACARDNPQEGPTVTYRLPTLLSLPTRGDEQIVEVARFELTPDYFYKAVPVLTPHVYRLANLTNKSEHVLLPGEATMYVGTDFVGRATLPLVAIGESFTAGFGIDPQLQVTRKLMDKNRVTQGGNQVLQFNYRIMLSSYKSEPVRVQVWDRLPTAEKQTIAVTLMSQKPDLSKDPMYLREERPRNLLRWDLTIEPGTYGEKALTVDYEFKMELERNLRIGSVLTK
jgi:uncharacterized protein (TIGR02231 family)